MKKKNLKLNFSKETIAKLQMSEVKGGQAFFSLFSCNNTNQNCCTQDTCATEETNGSNCSVDFCTGECTVADPVDNIKF